MNLLNEITNVINQLDCIDEYCENLPERQSIEEQKMQDLLHYIEFNKIGAFQSYRLIKKIKEIRNERRNIKNDMEISRLYKEHKNKLISSENRKFLVNNLHVKNKQLQDAKYSNRYYQNDEIKKILEGKL